MAIKTIKEVCIGRDVEAYEFQGDDGYPVGKSFSPICITTTDNKEYYLPIGQRKHDEDGFTYYTERYNAEKLLTKVYVRRYNDNFVFSDLEKAKKYSYFVTDFWMDHPELKAEIEEDHNLWDSFFFDDHWNDYSDYYYDEE